MIGKSYINRQSAAPRGPYEDRRRSFVVHTMCARVLSARDRRRSVYKPDSVWGAPTQSIVELSFSSFPLPHQSFPRPSPSGPQREKAGNILRSIINLPTYPRRIFNNVYWVSPWSNFSPLKSPFSLCSLIAKVEDYPFPNYKSTARDFSKFRKTDFSSRFFNSHTGLNPGLRANRPRLSTSSLPPVRADPL